MEVKIGVTYTAKELSIELEADPEELVATVEAALRNGEPVLWLKDRKGRRVGVPADKVAYVEIAEQEGLPRVGFGPG